LIHVTASAAAYRQNHITFKKYLKTFLFSLSF